ncbi:Ribosomal protein L22/L17 [Penicillium sp. DV-2018c]|nr:Ribosomal protein L22/L17 [Penicillium sp. DV-2018c]KAJ5577170.1 Ribosomal protein L22/L17 [Penicillium sp. DV-2018c]
MAIRAKASGMKIQYHNRSRLPAELEVAGAEYVFFDVPPAKQTPAKMKDGVVITNTARSMDVRTIRADQ